MYQLLFRSRWIAAIWALATLVSVATYVSEGGGNDKIAQTAADIKAQRNRLDRQEAGHSFVIEADPANQAEDGDFASGPRPDDSQGPPITAMDGD
jgi:hypothetical protein